MIRIIGIGSPFGADQLGWLAIEHLQTCRLADCELIKLDRPGSGLLAYFQGAEQVVLIDALQSPGRAGEVVAVSVDELANCVGLTSCHGFGVAEAISLAARLGNLPDRLDLLGIYTPKDLSGIPCLNKAALEERIYDLVRLEDSENQIEKRVC
jgi:hydrogenase maturation protease